MPPSTPSSAPSKSDPKTLQVGLDYPLMGTIACAVLLLGVIGYIGYKLASFDIQAPLTDVFLVFGFLAALVGGLLMRERLMFMQKRSELQAAIDKLEKERHFAWESKQGLQQECSHYAKQADKLSRFISDKLMTQIDYDEEFYHLKNTATEILEKGHISYQKLQKVLQEVEHDKLTEAQQANTYLWDLLELASVDDASAMIAKELVRCEERFYQIRINKVANESEPQPFFEPYQAILKAVGPMLKTAELDELMILVDQTENHEVSLFQTDHFRFHLQSTEHLLGKENHFVLMIEHLIQNAKSLSEQASFEQSSDRIALRLRQKTDSVAVSVYNRGPQLNEAEQKRLLKFGSERGLGLYFVSRIVEGYHGQISVTNTQNREQTFTVRIVLESGNVLTKVVECRCLNEVPKLRELDEMNRDVVSDSVTWSWQSPVVSIEVSSSREHETEHFSAFKSGDNRFLDPKNPYTPEWQLDVDQSDSSVDITLSALDIRGVRLEIVLPSAESFLKTTTS